MITAIVTLAGATLVTGCSTDEAPSAERFCAEVAANKDQLTNPSLTTDGDVTALLGLYREIGRLAPLAVEGDWATIVAAYETASSVLIGDEESEQAALTAIYSSERSAAAVERWLRDNCAVEIGPVFTVAPQNVPTNAVPPTSTAP